MATVLHSTVAQNSQKSTGPWKRCAAILAALDSILQTPSSGSAPSVTHYASALLETLTTVERLDSATLEATLRLLGLALSAMASSSRQSLLPAAASKDVGTVVIKCFGRCDARAVLAALAPLTLPLPILKMLVMSLAHPHLAIQHAAPGVVSSSSKKTSGKGKPVADASVGEDNGNALSSKARRDVAAILAAQPTPRPEALDTAVASLDRAAVTLAGARSLLDHYLTLVPAHAGANAAVWRLVLDVLFGTSSAVDSLSKEERMENVSHLCRVVAQPSAHVPSDVFDILIALWDSQSRGNHGRDVKILLKSALLVHAGRVGTMSAVDSALSRAIEASGDIHALRIPLVGLFTLIAKSGRAGDEVGQLIERSLLGLGLRPALGQVFDILRDAQYVQDSRILRTAMSAILNADYGANVVTAAHNYLGHALEAIGLVSLMAALGIDATYLDHNEWALALFAGHVNGITTPLSACLATFGHHLQAGEKARKRVLMGVLAGLTRNLKTGFSQSDANASALHQVVEWCTCVLEDETRCSDRELVAAVVSIIRVVPADFPRVGLLVPLLVTRHLSSKVSSSTSLYLDALRCLVSRVSAAVSRLGCDSASACAPIHRALETILARLLSIHEMANFSMRHALMDVACALCIDSMPTQLAQMVVAVVRPFVAADDVRLAKRASKMLFVFRSVLPVSEIATLVKEHPVASRHRFEMMSYVIATTTATSSLTSAAPNYAEQFISDVLLGCRDPAVKVRHAALAVLDTYATILGPVVLCRYLVAHLAARTSVLTTAAIYALAHVLDALFQGMSFKLRTSTPGVSSAQRELDLTADNVVQLTRAIARLAVPQNPNSDVLRAALYYLLVLTKKTKARTGTSVFSFVHSDGALANANRAAGIAASGEEAGMVDDGDDDDNDGGGQDFPTSTGRVELHSYPRLDANFVMMQCAPSAVESAMALYHSGRKMPGALRIMLKRLLARLVRTCGMPMLETLASAEDVQILRDVQKAMADRKDKGKKGKGGRDGTHSDSDDEESAEDEEYIEDEPMDLRDATTVKTRPKKRTREEIDEEEHEHRNSRAGDARAAEEVEEEEEDDVRRAPEHIVRKREAKRARTEHLLYGDIQSGQEFRGRKGAQGDVVKRNKQEPFAYVPLNTHFLNKRLQNKAQSRFERVSKTKR